MARYSVKSAARDGRAERRKPLHAVMEPTGMKRIVAASILALVLPTAALAQDGAKPADQAKPKQAQPAGKPDLKKKDAEKPAVTLKVGDKAPELKIDAWVKGEQITGFEKGKVYVVEFWATWCGPCIKNIPHLTELQKEYKDVAFIGVAASERGDDAKSKQDKVEKFVKEKGDEMGYRVAFDSDREMSKDWMQAAGQNGIPCAFIVDGEGKVAFIGHPAKDEFSNKLAELAGGDSKKDKPHADKPAKK